MLTLFLWSLLAVLLGVLVVDPLLRIALVTHEAPHFVPGDNHGRSDKPMVLVLDGFVGHPWLRWASVFLGKDSKGNVFEPGFEGYDVTFVNPNGELYSVKRTAKAVVDYMQEQLTKHGRREFILLAGSLGARIAQEVLVEIEALETDQPEVVKLILEYPLYNGTDVKEPLAKIIRRVPVWQPGPILSSFLQIFDVPGRFIVQGELTNDHQRYGRRISLLRVWQEAREAADRSNPPMPEVAPAKVIILHCDPEDDEVLKPSAIEAYSRLYPYAIVRRLPKGVTHHMGADTEPAVHADELRWALAA